MKRSVAAAGKNIRAALARAERNTVRTCSRCSKAVESDEYARSQHFFQRTYRYDARLRIIEGFPIRPDFYSETGRAIRAQRRKRGICEH